MRLVENRSPRPTLEAGLLPGADHLSRARGLAKRFPEAHLREVTLIRAPIERADVNGASMRVWLALECMQVTGSFKVRGALLAMEALVAAAKGAPVEVIAASAGNHGIGVSLASKVLGAKATIVVPRGAPKTKTDKIASYGATVVHAQSTGYDDAEAEAIELARTRGLPFLSPYDDLDVLTGNGASLGFEIIEKLGKVPELVYAPIGGGGLATGLALAVTDGSSTSRVWGVQSEASCAFAQSLETGVAVTTLPPAVTLAEGLEGGISVRGFARAREVLAGAVVVTEEELANAMRFGVRELGLTLEGSAAVALAAVLSAPPLKKRTEHEHEHGDLVVVLTGRNVDPDRLARVVC
ncbi:MAG: threonine dehydratase [Myxococcales bacterium]|nr:threonine dehydratase [Myxococcales bacterium]